RLHANNVTLKKKQQKIQSRLLAQERLVTLYHILQIKGLKQKEFVFGEKLYAALKILQHRRFSLSLLIFLLRNSDIVFFFKKKPWSQVKMACRLSLARETENKFPSGKLKGVISARKLPATNYHLNR